MAEQETPSAPVAEEAAKSVADNPTNDNADAGAQGVDLHGFTPDQLADMRKFFDNNGGFDGVKAKISNPAKSAAPEKKEEAQEAKPAPAEEAPAAPAYKAPEGSITAQEFMAKQYFSALAKEEKYAPISKEIASGSLLSEMQAFGINPVNQDGSLNDGKVRMYLDLKAQTVPAQQTNATPEAGAAPTVDYIPVEGDIKDMKQAMAVLQQDSSLRNAGMAGHPAAKAAEEFMRNQLNPNSKK